MFRRRKEAEGGAHREIMFWKAELDKVVHEKNGWVDKYMKSNEDGEMLRAELFLAQREVAAARAQLEAAQRPYDCRTRAAAGPGGGDDGSEAAGSAAGTHRAAQSFASGSASASATSSPAKGAVQQQQHKVPYGQAGPLPCSPGAGGADLEDQLATARPCAAAPPAAPPPYDYINASHIVLDEPQYGIHLSYIACQGPLAATVADFWRMVWAEHVGAVVMLTNTVERGVTKCAAYYPASPGARLALRVPGGGDGGGGGAAGGRAGAAGRGAPGAAGGWCGCDAAAAPTPAAAPCLEEVAVASRSSLHGGDLTHTRLTLLPCPPAPGGAPAAAGCAPPREVHHLRYNAWPDHGTPADAAAIRTLLDLLEPVRAAGAGVVVHCSAGIGRTGTFVAIDVLRRRLSHLAARACAPGAPAVGAAEVAAALDLPELVHVLRRQRSGMVQTVEQYAFCYQARLMDGRQLTDEFRTLLARDQAIRLPHTAAQVPANVPRNRYVNVLPYDHNRVLLQPCAAAPPAAPPPYDYINASHIVLDEPQYGIHLSYIACQGPLAATVADFWRMVWAEHVGAVVMLTNTVERGVTKCAAYYPASPGARLALRVPGGGDGGGGGAAGGRAGAAGRGAPGAAGGWCGCDAAAAPTPAAAPCLEEVAVASRSSLHGGDLTHTRLTLLPCPPAPGGAPAAAGCAPPRE
ncbi:Receptor-type tyrosine-protein phosphatase epsilon, partial [Tetrabaena socialis]